jgi:hypothetical protein
VNHTDAVWTGLRTIMGNFKSTEQMLFAL